MKNWIYILIILTSCIQYREKKIIYDKIWIEANTLITSSFDSSFFILNNNYYDYKLSNDILTIWIVNDANDSLTYVEDTIQFKIDYIGIDSLILTDLNPETEIAYGKELQFYSKNILYDTLINLKSITFEMGRYDEDYPSEVITLKKDTLFLRADSGIVEYKTNRFSKKTVDYYTNIGDSAFYIIEDLIRCSNFELMDTIFKSPFHSHNFWTVTIKYNNKTKKIKGKRLSPSFQTIWFNIMKIAHDYELKLISENYEKEWTRI